MCKYGGNAVYIGFGTVCVFSHPLGVLERIPGDKEEGLLAPHSEGCHLACVGEGRVGEFFLSCLLF